LENDHVETVDRRRGDGNADRRRLGVLGIVVLCPRGVVLLPGFAMLRLLRRFVLRPELTAADLT
jgi:hypothetical protein